MFLFVLAVFLLLFLIGLAAFVFHRSALHQHTTMHPHPHQPGFWFFAAMPFLQGIGAFLFTALFCWLYNRLARFTGGVELNVVGPSEALAETGSPLNL
jgi:hypothetical protein